MHAVNAFAKLFQKLPRCELASQLQQMFGQAPCMVPVCTTTHAGQARALEMWPQVLRTVAEGESVKGFPVKPTEASLAWERRVREVLCHPESSSMFQDCQVDIKEQVSLLESHILCHVSGTASAPGVCMHAENQPATENQGQKSAECSMGGALRASELPVYIAVAGFDQSALVDAFIAALRKADAQNLGLPQNVIEIMIKEVKRNDLHLTLWHKNGFQGSHVSGSCGADDSSIQCTNPSPERVEDRVGEKHGVSERQKLLNWYAYGRACMQLEGQEVLFLAHGFDLSKRCAAAGVELLGDAVLSCMSGEAVGQKDRMHVTLWTSQGVKAREAGELRGLVERGKGGAVHVMADTPLQLKGIVSLFH
jgi:hypothetical protein